MHLRRLTVTANPVPLYCVEEVCTEGPVSRDHLLWLIAAALWFWWRLWFLSWWKVLYLNNSQGTSGSVFERRSIPLSGFPASSGRRENLIVFRSLVRVWFSVWEMNCLLSFYLLKFRALYEWNGKGQVTVVWKTLPTTTGVILWYHRGVGRLIISGLVKDIYIWKKKVISVKYDFKAPGFWENEIVHVLGVLGTVFGKKKKPFLCISQYENCALDLLILQIRLLGRVSWRICLVLESYFF